ncbi:ABC-2 type transport system permease protein [Arthrobacter stackebrandtii]|uniref:Transport permease protein n=1 Tax=Arthrobacter stackebrandtii TaxID=272161 RepID=A0ABS4YR98_9MICC|nr:ABC transporter permease [Arthrobacter stackebrandtii]MBP2411311.1 ABC-2 type transport system permease protein [Arthrobacter stackebrandtii]
MNGTMMWATSTRVLRQLKGDPRSIAMILVVPAVLLALVYWLYQNETLAPGQPRTFDRVGLMMLGIFPFVVMFLVTSITMLRERTSGTLERLLTTPIHKADLLFGYALAFSIMAAAQALVATGTAYWIFGLEIAGNAGWVVLISVLTAVLGVALGLLCSAFATTEFQAVQFMPVVVIPQILLCGLFVARDQMNGVLEAVSNVLPLSYAVDGLQEVAAHADPTSALVVDLVVVAAFVVAGLLFSSLTLRRQTA